MSAVIDERPAADRLSDRHIVQRTPLRGSQWRLASRLARREVRRRPGRTALVTLLVAVPVLGMTIASVLAHTQRDSWVEDFERSYGATDVVVQRTSTSAVTSGQPSPDDVDETTLQGFLPVGSRVERYGQALVQVANEDRIVTAWVNDLDLSSSLLAGAVTVTDGASPEGDGEIALDRSTADEFGVDVGDDVVLTAPAGTWTVAGVIRREADWEERLVVFGEFDWERVSPNERGVIHLVDLPDGTTPAQITSLVADLRRFGLVAARDLPESGSPTSLHAKEIAWGWVAGAMALSVLGIIVAAAFATSARRQLVTLGQLSANGADQRLLRRMMVLQGTWNGLLGSVAGVGSGLVLLVVGHGVVEQLVRRDIGSYDIRVLDLVVIALTGTVAATVAAHGPARRIAQAPVMAALAGRRPLGAVPRRLVPIGLGLFGVGLVLLAGAAIESAPSSGSDDLYAAFSLLGGNCVLFGMCCLSPLAVDLVGRLGTRWSGSWRLSARSLARTRSRSAGVVTGTAAAGALALAGATVFSMSGMDDVSDMTGYEWGRVVSVEGTISGTDPAEEVVSISNGVITYDPWLHEPVAIPPSILNHIRDVVGGGQVHVRRVARWDPAPYQAMDRDGGRVRGGHDDGRLVVADPFVIDMFDLSAGDRDRLAEVGVMNPLWGPTGEALLGEELGDPTDITVAISGRPAQRVPVIGAVDPVDLSAHYVPTIVTPERALELGLEVVDDGVFIQMDDPLTDDQVEQLGVLNYESSLRLVFDASDEDQRQVGVIISPNVYDTGSHVDPTLVNLAIVLAAVLFTLSVVGVGLALSAAESRDERDILSAIGATPATLRRIAGQKAFLLAVTGTLLAVPTGLLPVIVVARALREEPGDYTIDNPWPMIATLVVVVPVVVALATWAGSAFLQRRRPVRMSTLATD